MKDLLTYFWYRIKYASLGYNTAIFCYLFDKREEILMNKIKNYKQFWSAYWRDDNFIALDDLVEYFYQKSYKDNKCI